MANNESNTEINKCTCGVPLNLHATCCGWANANLIIYPSNEQEREWQRLKLEATGMQIVINGKSTVLVTGINSNGQATDNG